jgi:hypothetical protein
MVGAGIGLAAMGIGEMAKGFANLKDVDMVNIGLGMMGIAGAASMLANPLSIIGLGAIGLALYGISELDFSNVVPLQNLKFVDNDIKNIREVAALLAQISSVDTAKLNALQNLFANANFKFTLDGDAVLKSTINLDFGREFSESITRFVDSRVPIAIRKGNAPN